jgi:hypothetical protein
LRLSLALTEARGEGEAAPGRAFLGGLIHDVDRDKKNHEAQAAARLAALGWPRLGRIVGQHKDLDWPPAAGWDLGDLRAAMAVYLADKYFVETEAATLAERFGAKIGSFDSPKARSKALARLARAEKVEAWFREALGLEPGLAASRRSGHPLEGLADRLEKELRPI